jgi:carboxylesterase
MDKQLERGLHQPFLYEAAKSKTAVLMVHGILGSPTQFEAIAKALHDQGYAVMAVLLPGHGGSALDFAKAKPAEWQQEVHRAFLYLKQRYDRVWLIGHSMGGLLSIIEAVGYNADGLVIISTPMRLKPGFKAMRIALRILLGDPKKDDEVMLSYRNANSIQKGPAWVYPLWIPRLASVLGLMRKTHRLLGRVKVPVLCIQSRRDETVSWKSQRIFVKHLQATAVETMLIEQSGHSYFHPDELGMMREMVIRFLGNHSMPPEKG